MKYLIHSLLRTDLVVSLSRFGFALLVLSCCFATTASEAQTTEILPEKHLEFRGISLGQPRDAFADLLRAKGYEITTPQHPTSSSSVWMKGRYDSFHCLLELSASGNTQLVDSVTVWFQDVNNPVGNYRVLRGFYTRRYGQPVADNFYNIAELGYASPEEQLASDSYATLFSLDGGTVTMRLSYAPKEKAYKYSLLFVDHQSTEKAAEQISDNSNHIDEEW